jgi:6-phosphogluconolactonase
MENLTRRSLLIGLSTLAIAESLPALAQGQPEATTAFIGVYTNKDSKSKGIYAYRWNAKSGELSPLGLAAATANPSFLAVSRDRKVLYAANEVDDYKGAKDGAVSAFAADAHAGKLTLLNEVSSGGAGPCNINLDHTGKAVLVANYDGGSAATFRVLSGGKASAAVEDIHYAGTGPDKERQEAPHAHCATASPDNRYVLINDLGLDCIHIYKFDAATARLTPNNPPAYHAMPKSGPRSFVFHPNGRIAYSTNELSNTVDVLAWDASAGTLTRIQNITTVAEGLTELAAVASVVIDRAGKFLYVSNRLGENSIVVFSVDPSTGKLTFVQRMPSGGKVPRHFALDPTERWLVAAHQNSHTLVVFAREPSTGNLMETGRKYPIDYPTCVLFA